MNEVGHSKNQLEMKKFAKEWRAIHAIMEQNDHLHSASFLATSQPHQIGVLSIATISMEWQCACNLPQKTHFSDVSFLYFQLKGKKSRENMEKRKKLAFQKTLELGSSLISHSSNKN
jgi:hypothetical protein